MASESQREQAVLLLRQKEREIGRLPKKEDFDEVTRSRIKAFLGPWPRALEAAGLKTAALSAHRTKKRKKAASPPARGRSDAESDGARARKEERR